METQFLRPLYEVMGPVASVHLDTTRDDRDAGQKIDLRWQGLRRDLARQGADEPTLLALDAAVGGATHVPGPQGEALFAAEGELLADHVLAEPPRHDSAAWLPVAAPLAAAVDRDHQLAHVMVAVDPEGADIEGYAPSVHLLSLRRTFNGSTLHSRRAGSDSNAQRQYRRRGDNVWSENAAQVARDVVAAAAELDAAVVFAGGDAKAVAVLREHLERLPFDLPFVEVEGDPADTDTERGLRRSVDAALSEATGRNRAGVLLRFTAALEQDEAVQGLPAVKDALAKGRVGTLLMACDRTGDPALWASRRDPLNLATTRAGLGDDPTAFTAPAGTLLLRAATLGGAGFTQLLDAAGVPDGAGALLRY